MLDIFRHDDIVVAHFNHGTRPSSKDDANFVKKCAEERNLTFALGTAKLGEGVSEEVARRARYNFLHKACETSGHTKICTAHHLDDLVETVAINLLRGTGWRGLAALDAPMVRRPFLEPEDMPKSLRKLVPFDKKTILRYAADFEITYRQDPTNNEDSYLRNRVRKKLSNFDKKHEIYALWQKQKKLKREIDELVGELMPEGDEPWQRSWFEGLDEKVALELLRAGTLRAGISATRPQLERFYQAILTYAPGKAFNLPKDELVTFTKTDFFIH